MRNFAELAHARQRPRVERGRSKAHDRLRQVRADTSRSSDWFFRLS